MSAKLCHHLYDTGATCASVAAKNYDYCGYHLSHRARLMRMAQYRARNQRYALRLPPLENLYAVNSALNQLAEAAAAGMIDLKQARFLLSVVRAAGHFLLHADKWQANPYRSDQPIEIDLAKAYGLPTDPDLDTSLETASPPPTDEPLPSVILSEGGGPFAPPQSKSRRFAGVGAGSRDPERAQRVEGDPFSSPSGPQLSEVGNCGNELTGDWRPAAGDSALPSSGSYCADHHSHECDCVRIRPDFPVTPEIVEVVETDQAYGPDAAAARSKQLERNRERRRLTRERKRYQAIALEHNMRLAAERIAQQKLAQHAKEQAGTAGWPTPPSVGGVGVFADPAKKPVASVHETAATEAKSSA